VGSAICKTTAKTYGASISLTKTLTSNKETVVAFGLIHEDGGAVLTWVSGWLTSVPIGEIDGGVIASVEPLGEVGKVYSRIDDAYGEEDEVKENDDDDEKEVKEERRRRSWRMTKKRTGGGGEGRERVRRREGTPTNGDAVRRQSSNSRVRQHLQKVKEGEEKA